MAARNKSKRTEGPKTLPADVCLNRISKVLALFAVRDIKNQGEQISLLGASGFSVPEIAEMLETTTNTVSVRLSQQKSKLKGRKRRGNSRGSY